MIMPMRSGPNEQIRTGRRRADHQIGVPGIMGEEVESHDPVLPRGDAPVLHVVIVRAECFAVNMEISDYGYQVDAHLSSLTADCGLLDFMDIVKGLNQNVTYSSEFCWPAMRRRNERAGTHKVTSPSGASLRGGNRSYGQRRDPGRCPLRHHGFPAGLARLGIRQEIAIPTWRHRWVGFDPAR